MYELIFFFSGIVCNHVTQTTSLAILATAGRFFSQICGTKSRYFKQPLRRVSSSVCSSWLKQILDEMLGELPTVAVKPGILRQHIILSCSNQGPFSYLPSLFQQNKGKIRASFLQKSIAGDVWPARIKRRIRRKVTHHTESCTRQYPVKTSYTRTLLYKPIHCQAFYRCWIWSKINLKIFLFSFCTGWNFCQSSVCLLSTVAW